MTNDELDVKAFGESMAAWDSKAREVQGDYRNRLAADGLQMMLGMQGKIESAWGRMPDPNDAEQISQYIREVVLCVTDELHELLNEVHWKPWKDARGIKDVARYREELADVLHFVFDLYLAAGLSGRDMLMDYLAKHQENLDRRDRAEYRAG